MFRNAKVGDKVWDYLCGWGTIVKISDDNNNNYPLTIYFNIKEEATYTFNGKRYMDELNPRLFWNEIKFEIPEKPFNLEDELRKLEIKEFKLGKNNYFLTWNNQFECITKYHLNYFQNPFFIFFTGESINDFMKNVDSKGITKEQFFTAYKNVFGGIINE